jgi:hypothetical protein
MSIPLSMLRSVSKRLRSYGFLESKPKLLQEYLDTKHQNISTLMLSFSAFVLKIAALMHVFPKTKVQKIALST